MIHPWSHRSLLVEQGLKARPPDSIITAVTGSALRFWLPFIGPSHILGFRLDRRFFKWSCVNKQALITRQEDLGRSLPSERKLS